MPEQQQKRDSTPLCKIGFLVVQFILFVFEEF
jgi:hypothetical protein